MIIGKALLKSFSAANHTAAVMLSGNYKTITEGINVARNISVGEMIPGRYVAVLFYDSYSAKDALIIAVYDIR
ncbi:MAG: hypothetical protein WC958_00590 [Dehalococcoidales bacterium]